MLSYSTYSAYVVVLLCAYVAQQPAETLGGEKTPKKQKAKKALDAEPTMSVFGDKVRCFRFQFEKESVSYRMAEAFMVRYNGDDENPEIIGAYPDLEKNILCIVGPPEAEHAIRVNLATWIVQSQGLGSTSLKAQRRALEFQRKDLLSEMAELEITAIGTAEEKAVQVNARARSFAEALETTEKQLEVIERYLSREKDRKREKKKRRPRRKSAGSNATAVR